MRFIVAPYGYGKTLLAIDYAETMFAWEHTFWLSGESPCFIRDLDAKSIASACIDVDEEVALVVVDDLPLLDSTRSAALAGEIDRLLKHGCEVIVTSIPSHDTVAQFQPSRLRLCAREMLLADDELDEGRKSEERLRLPAAKIFDAQRIPLFVWGKDDGAQSAFAQGVFSEELPSDVLLAFASVLVLRDASVEDLKRIGVTDEGIIADLVNDYPHVGFNGETGSFEATCLDSASIASALNRKLASLVAKSAFETQEELVMTWADILVGKGRGSRACDFMRLICPRACRARWLIDNAWELSRQASFYSGLQLAKDQKGVGATLRARMAAFEAFCRCVLGDDAGALRAAKRCAFDVGAPEDARICAALIVARLGKGKVYDQNQLFLASVAQDEPGPHLSDWRFLAQAWCASPGGPNRLVRLWKDYRGVSASDDVLCICASWLYSLYSHERWMEEEKRYSGASIRRDVERYIRKRLSESDGQMLDYFAASAGLSLEEAHQRGIPYCDGPLETPSMFKMRVVETAVLAQRGDYESDLRAARVKRDDWVATRPDSYLDARKQRMPGSAQKRIPILRLKLFGGFEASIGDAPIDSQRFKRQHVRNLIALLAVNQGREVSRDQLTRAMWPESSAEVRRKNFYTVWSQLKSVLSLPDGTCPYLVRQQYGCSFERRYVQSDVERFSEICRELLFGTPDVDRWSELYKEIDRDFSSDLVPSERKNQMIIQVRDEYRSRLVDALVSAAYAIVAEGYPQWGIWFARSATRFDMTREDAYVALMRAEIAASQRTAAMMTFLRCRKVLGEQLGIDPSPETSSLYENLLNGE